jgi:hypothetical protein
VPIPRSPLVEHPRAQTARALMYILLLKADMCAAQAMSAMGQKRT